MISGSIGGSFKKQIRQLLVDVSSRERPGGERVPLAEGARSGDVVTTLETAEGEVFSGADGVIDIHPAVHRDLAPGMHEAIAEVVDQIVGRFELFLTRTAVLEITHETDADAGIVDAGFAHMTTPELFGPAGTDLDFTVSGIASVADYEMIGEAMLHAASPVIGIVGASIARLNAAVVDDDVTPAVAVDLDLFGRGNDGRERREGREVSRDDEPLADENLIARNFIARLKGFDGRAGAFGNGREGVTFFHLVGGFVGIGGRTENVA